MSIALLKLCSNMGRMTSDNFPPEAVRPIELNSISEKEAKGAVLLFHGLTGVPSEVADLASEFHKQGYAVFAPLLSGHGSTIEELHRTPTKNWLADVEKIFHVAKQRAYSPIVVCGVSFGSLLALYLASKYPNDIQTVIALSLPFEFRSMKREIILPFLSFLPDSLLESTSLVEKTKRAANSFSRPRHSYSMHSTAAAARLVQIRRTVIKQLKKIECPVLILQDPHDHHLSPNGPRIFRKACQAPVDLRWIPGGQHELTLGAFYQDVIRDVVEFVEHCNELD